MEIWVAVWDAFNAPLFSLGADPVTPLSLLVLILIFAVTWFVAGRVRWLLEKQIGNRVEEIPEGLLHVIGALARYTIIFMGWFIGLRSVGFQLDAVLVIFASLGVGMGFGLQNITNNFVSGLILLIERPVQVGDVIGVAGEVGIVERVGIRATTLRKFDQTQAIVPNGDLISSVVNNWTLDDRRVRVDFVVGGGLRLGHAAGGAPDRGGRDGARAGAGRPRAADFLFRVRGLVTQLPGAGVRGRHQRAVRGVERPAFHD